jgi:hypothetical protein
MTAERIEVARRLIDASVTLIKSQEDYVLALNRAGMHVPAMLAFELLLIMRATLAFREARSARRHIATASSMTKIAMRKSVAAWLAAPR